MIRIDPEFKALIPPLTAEEYAGLEESIVRDGCRDAIVLWDDIIIDGHNRYRICTAHNLPYKTVKMDFADRYAAIDWMYKNQLGRRNLTDEQRTYLLGKLYQARKHVHGFHTENRNPDGTFQSLQNGNTGEQNRVSEQVAKEQGVAKNTVLRSYKFSQGIDSIRKVDSALAEDILKADTKMPKKDVMSIKTPADAYAFATAIKTQQNKPHVSNASGNNEWYTPEKYVSVARDVLGEIDIDPASCELANRTVKAKTYFDIESDGLSKPWCGKVWMNPPYSSDLIQQFAYKIVDEYRKGNTEEAIVLVNNATETQWFSHMMLGASAVAFPKGRIQFESPNGKLNSPLQGQAFIYFGKRPGRFSERFKDIGWVAMIDD